MWNHTVYFCYWLISLRIMSSHFIRAIAMARLPFSIRLNNIPLSIHSTYYIYSSINGHLGCFYLSPITNNAVIKVDVQISFRGPTFTSFGCILRSGVARSYNSSNCKFLRNYNTVFQAVAPFCNHANSVQGFLIPILTNTFHYLFYF